MATSKSSLPKGNLKCDTTDEDTTSPHFSQIPDQCWLLVSSLAAPPDVYNLCLSSKHFHIPTSSDETASNEDADADNTTHTRKKPATNNNSSKFTLKTCDMCNEAQWYGLGHGTTCGTCQEAATSAGTRKRSRAKVAVGASATPLLATRLLRESLLSSLGRVLEYSESGITLDSALALADLPSGSAIIAGSTIAQACLGELWGEKRSRSDVDVLCTAKAAPKVRSWLVESANGMFVGFRDYGIQSTDEQLAYTVDTNIHHVEHWGSLEKNVNEDLEMISGYSGSGGKSVLEANKEGAGIDIATLKNTDYYRDAVSWGKNCQSQYVDFKWKQSMSFDILGVDQNKVYNIKPKPGGDLPFDFDGEGNIDLIVGRKNVNSSLTLLDDFDLTICKASFDGKTFRIPDPHRTFSRKSTMEPNRRAVVESYVKHFNAPASRYMTGIDAATHALATIKKVRKDVPRAPCYKQLDMAARLPDRYNPDEFMGRGSMYDPMVQAKHSAPCMFHNCTLKLILRLRKYQERGIDVIDAPTIAADFDSEEFALTSWGG